MSSDYDLINFKTINFPAGQAPPFSAVSTYTYLCIRFHLDAFIEYLGSFSSQKLHDYIKKCCILLAPVWTALLIQITEFDKAIIRVWLLATVLQICTFTIYKKNFLSKEFETGIFYFVQMLGR